MCFAYLTAASLDTKTCHTQVRRFETELISLPAYYRSASSHKGKQDLCRVSSVSK